MLWSFKTQNIEQKANENPSFTLLHYSVPKEEVACGHQPRQSARHGTAAQDTPTGLSVMPHQRYTHQMYVESEEYA